MGKLICFYLGKPCRYGDDAPPEEQMECSQCPAFIMWRLMHVEPVSRPEEDSDNSEDPSDPPSE